MRVLIIAHAHPELSAGGGERAAYSLFQHLKRVDVIDPVFVGRADATDIGHDAWFGSFRGRHDEVLWTPPALDSFRRITNAHDVLRLQVRELVTRFEPDVVHFHHYIFFGLDAIGLFKELSGCTTILTLHEYALICHNDGQMVKTKNLRLCYGASPAGCHACFPEYTAGKFFVRREQIIRQLDRVDHLISPSRFLRDRHIAWGIDPNRISVVENVLPPDFCSEGQASPAASSSRDRRRIRVGFFGQLNQYKGALVLIDAIRHMASDVSANLELVLFGAKLDQQSEQFRDALTRAIADGNARIRLLGPYRHEDVAALMRSVDWIVVPSTWWENSPLVIQEARAVGTPILVSNIGGMAEKVRDGADGIHFLVGNPTDLAEKLEAIVDRRIAITPEPVDCFGRDEAVLQAHLRIYRKHSCPQNTGAGKEGMATGECKDELV